MAYLELVPTLQQEAFWLLISKGGTTILTEVPEMFGAETILMDRCENKELFNETINLINNFKIL